LSHAAAVVNRLGLLPSPLSLSRRFHRGYVELPVLVTVKSDGNYVTDSKDPLNEVKRYWAWRLARPGEPIPVIVLEPPGNVREAQTTNG
jgi:hypothetical protein